MIRRLSKSVSAEDVVQETFLRVAQLDSISGIKHPKAYLFTIAANIVRNQHRKASRQQANFERSQDLIMGGSISSADQAEALLLKQVILSLPKTERDYFLLSRFGGLSYQQIAELRGVTVKTVEWRISRALALCAAKLRG
jgi:RNA polymerase sigma-70 factor (ECF subfamily)